MAVVNRRVSFSTAKPTVIPVILDSQDLPVRQSSYEPPPAGRPVPTITSEMRRQSWLAAAEARRRAVELADGGGLMVPSPEWCRPAGQGKDVYECWPGSAVDVNEVRKYPILWERGFCADFYLQS